MFSLRNKGVMSVGPNLGNDLNYRLNGMLHHSLATLEGEWEFIDFYRALLSREGSPLSLFIEYSNHLNTEQQSLVFKW